MSADPVRDYLQSMECPPHVIAGGLSSLVADWEKNVGEIERGYKLGLDDYLNDMDARQLLHDALMLATVVERNNFLERVKAADKRVQKHLEPLGFCLWGDEVADEENWDAEENWWYYSRPIHVSDEFLEELGG